MTTTAYPTAQDIESGAAERLLALRDGDFGSLPMAWVPLDDLTVSASPRLDGQDSVHVRALADTEAALPAILVHRPDMRVIDGTHRLLAARLAGRKDIAVRFFSGSEEEAFLLSVACNIVHGKPLSLADRVAAAARLLDDHPRWSDRCVASVVGLSAHKVAEVRRSSDGPAAQGISRIGQDGRVRPLNAAEGRRLACEIITREPQASLRQIARQAGISPATVADVRERMQRGVDPVPDRQRGAVSGAGDDAGARGVPGREPETVSFEKLLALSETLRKDPSLRFNEVGRLALRLFDACAVFVRQQHAVTAQVPPHCKRPMAELLTSYARLWQSYADELSRDAVPLSRAL
ncbi:transcriptional regulator [Streptomyces sp. NPDC048278]|uniref:ParB/RepB/Spo0J family partition protein n=1 Tax=Streptomyces sp. NPDC048278 TaxID=3155809 RepID=UPI00341306DE